MFGNEAVRHLYNGYRKLPIHADGDATVLDVICLETMMTASIEALQSTDSQPEVRIQKNEAMKRNIWVRVH